MLRSLGTALQFLLLGFVVGLLVAPRSGRETRHLLRQSVSTFLGCAVSPYSERERLRAIEEQISCLE